MEHFKLNRNLEFIFTEVLIFIVQTVAIFLVIVFLSGMLQNKEELIKIATSKISSSKELILTLLALTSTLGIVTFVKEIIPNKQISSVFGETINEFPRVFYFFGSNITGAAFAVGLFNQEHGLDGVGFYGAGIIFGVIFFLYGCFFKYLLRNAHESRK